MSRRVVPLFLRATRANRAYVAAEAARAHLAAQSLRPAPYGPPRRLRRDVTVSVSHVGGWPVYTVAPQAQSRGGMIYAHGGGWVNEIQPQHWQLVAQVAAEAHLTVTVPIYPLVPFGTAGPVVGRIADLVLDSLERHGTSCLAGDSAGGQIALSAALLLRDRDQVVLPRTTLISPAVDLTFGNPQIAVVQPSDPWLGTPGGRVFAEHWRGDLPITDPLVSPLFGDLDGLGALTLFTGTHDILNPDARLLTEKATTAGVVVDLREEAGLVHVYPLTPTPEGRAARRVIVQQARATTSSSRA